MLLVKRAFSVRQGKWLLLEPLVSGGMQSTSGNCRLFIVYSVSRRGWLMATLEECASWPPWRSVPHGHLGGVCLMATLEEYASWPPWRSVPHGHLGGVCLMATLEECAFAIHSSYFLKLKWRSEIDYCEMANQTYFEVKVSFERLLFYQFCFQLPIIRQLTLPSTYHGIDVSE